MSGLMRKLLTTSIFLICATLLFYISSTYMGLESWTFGTETNIKLNQATNISRVQIIKALDKSKVSTASSTASSTNVLKSTKKILSNPKLVGGKDKPTAKLSNTLKPIDIPSQHRTVEKPPDIPKVVEKPPDTHKAVAKPPDTPKSVEKQPNTHKPVIKSLNTHKPVEKALNTHRPQKQTSNTLKLVTTSKAPKSLVTPRPDTCKDCFPSNFEILLENKRICETRPGEKLDLVIIIFTYKDSFSRRATIRKTWTQHTKNNTANTRYLFAFGRYPTKKANDVIEKESKTYGDIVQGGFGESYFNLTYKTITMLGWVVKNCPNVKNVMKTDDDMWVNIPEIVTRFQREPLSKTVAGYCILHPRPIRSKSSKWYASRLNYPRNIYPPFCSGTGYVMDIGTAIDIHRISADVPFLYLEDVYVALCLERLGYHVRSTSGFHNGKFPMANLCLFKTHVLTSHYMSTNDINRIWDAKC